MTGLSFLSLQLSNPYAPELNNLHAAYSRELDLLSARKSGQSCETHSGFMSIDTLTFIPMLQYTLIFLFEVLFAFHAW
jgi:hypothetical protein